GCVRAEVHGLRARVGRVLACASARYTHPTGPNDTGARDRDWPDADACGGCGAALLGKETVLKRLVAI
ncbi:MAG: hypothetical protein ACREX5_05925, partial [Achromobacter pestifer]